MVLSRFGVERSIPSIPVAGASSYTIFCASSRPGRRWTFCMGQVIDLAERREAAKRKTRRREPVRAQFFFDLACPFTYLASERVERAFSHVTWTATSSETLQRRCLADDLEG